MTTPEFTTIVDFLIGNSATTPTDEQLDARLQALWQDVQDMPAERFQRGANWLIRQPDFRYFPTVGEMLEAIRQADRAAGESIPCNMTEQERRCANDPEYCRQMREIAAQSEKEWLESPEYKQLCERFQFLRGEEAKRNEAKRRRRLADNARYMDWLTEHEPKGKPQ